MEIDYWTGVIVVDMQPDFMPGGALPVAEGDTIVPYVNEVMNAAAKKMAPVVKTQDWHPPNHCSFKEFGGIWPAHCVQDTPGAALHPDLSYVGTPFFKAYNEHEDCYSGMKATKNENGKVLTVLGYLNEIRVNKVLVVGLAADFCVKATALDSVAAGFETYVDLKGTKFVFPEKAEETIRELEAAGVIVVGKDV